jgi:ribonuclease HII
MRRKASAPAPTTDLPSLFGSDDPIFETEFAAGVDEAGRGPLAGPVCAAAVILDPKRPIEGLNDSKKLSAKRREELAVLIRERAEAWSVAWGSVEEIDAINILQATMAAMRRAVAGLSVRPRLVIVDGNRVPEGLGVPAVALVKGDARAAAISAASILAKTSRDALMRELDEKYPGYGFARHAGYGTAAHIEAIRRLGISPVHRKTFEPVKSMLLGGNRP